ncbi:MAG: 3-oxoacyl-ACP reductase FabG [Clostridia bacterium]|nr:3-oxoacyl-ACP reductase FabG [Clostridia bacterium]
MKNVLITGGSRGIGAQAVRAFCADGCRVAFTYRKSKDMAEALAEECGAIAICADSRCESDVLRAVELATDALGGIDVLINNAAVSSIKPFDTVSLDEWRDTIDTSVTGAFLFSKAVFSQMLNKKWGRIINISSIWGLVGASCEVHYSTAKAALIGFTRALAKELSPSGITVNAIAPGLIDTDMNRALDAETLEAIIDETPVRRIGTPGDVVEAIRFLSSDRASFITGEVINVSGGFVI